MGYTIHYSPTVTPDEDRRAIIDFIQYTGLKNAKLLIRELKRCESAADYQHVNCLFGFAGITGRPFFAAGRRWAPAAHEAWWNDPQYG